MTAKNKLAIITGAGTGIGEAISEALIKLDQNYQILAIGRREAPLKALQEKLQQDYPNSIRIVSADVSTENGREKIATSINHNDEIKFLIHNAGVLNPVGTIDTISLEDWRNHMAINLEAPLFLTQTLLSKLSGARVLHISSGAAQRAVPNWTAYCCSKSALHMLYQCLREELREKNILVGSVRPGVVDTPIQTQIREMSDEKFPEVKYFRDLKAHGELISPEQCANFITDFLINSSDDEYIKEEWDIYK